MRQGSDARRLLVASLGHALLNRVQGRRAAVGWREKKGEENPLPLLFEEGLLLMGRRDKLQSRSAPVLGPSNAGLPPAPQIGMRLAVSGLLRPRTDAPRLSPSCGWSSTQRGCTVTTIGFVPSAPYCTNTEQTAILVARRVPPGDEIVSNS